jgi:hypothetical protein
VKTLPGDDIDPDYNILVAELQTMLKAIKIWKEETNMKLGKT